MTFENSLPVDGVVDFLWHLDNGFSKIGFYDGDVFLSLLVVIGNFHKGLLFRA